MANKNDIEAAIAVAEAETGVRGGRGSIPLCFSDPKKRGVYWNEKDEKFLRANYQRLSKLELCEALRRTWYAIRIHIARDMHLPAISKAPDILSAEQVANGLGCDSKSVHLLIDSGRMPGKRLPSVRTMRVVGRIALLRWMLNPDHWMYFKPGRVGELFRSGKRGIGGHYDFCFWTEAKKLITREWRRWDDQWLTSGQAARRLKINPKKYRGSRARSTRDTNGGFKYVNLAIRKGYLKATRWGNYWIKKSDLPGPGKTINYCGKVVNSAKEKK